jgi:hypothetical protein
VSWQYRVMRSVGGRGTTHYYTYGIHEVYTGPKGWTEASVGPHGDTLYELKRDLEMMLEALKKPVLDAKTGRVAKEPK